MSQTAMGKPGRGAVAGGDGSVRGLREAVAGDCDRAGSRDAAARLIAPLVAEVLAAIGGRDVAVLLQDYDQLTLVSLPGRAWWWRQQLMTRVCGNAVVAAAAADGDDTPDRGYRCPGHAYRVGGDCSTKPSTKTGCTWPTVGTRRMEKPPHVE